MFKDCSFLIDQCNVGVCQLGMGSCVVLFKFGSCDVDPVDFCSVDSCQVGVCVEDFITIENSDFPDGVSGEQLVNFDDDDILSVASDCDGLDYFVVGNFNSEDDEDWVYFEISDDGGFFFCDF